MGMMSSVFGGMGPRVACTITASKSAAAQAQAQRMAATSAYAAALAADVTYQRCLLNIQIREATGGFIVAVGVEEYVAAGLTEILDAVTREFAKVQLEK